MKQLHFVSLAIVFLTFFISFKGFNSNLFFDKYCFHIQPVKKEKDYKRFITSGFLHSNWAHLLFNMFSLLAFANQFEEFEFFLIYFGSLIGGNLLTYFFYKNYENYRAIGASGAVCGVIFAFIVLSPDKEMSFMMLPLRLPAWLYGVVYVAYTMYNIKNKTTNTAHEAHLGGSLVGLVIALAFYPQVIASHFLYILLIVLPVAVFLYSIYDKKTDTTYRPYNTKEEYVNPMSQAFDDWFPTEKRDNQTIDDKYNNERNKMQAEVDRILDKINRLGRDAITNEERRRLQDYSEKLNRK